MLTHYSIFSRNLNLQIVLSNEDYFDVSQESEAAQLAQKSGELWVKFYVRSWFLRLAKELVSLEQKDGLFHFKTLTLFCSHKNFGLIKKMFSEKFEEGSVAFEEYEESQEKTEEEKNLFLSTIKSSLGDYINTKQFLDCQKIIGKIENQDLFKVWGHIKNQAFRLKQGDTIDLLKAFQFVKPEISAKE